MDIPSDLKYTSDHEWARPDGARVRVGITDFAQEALGDIVYVALPKVGAEAKAGEPIGEIESTKSVSEIYAPVSGSVVEVNEALTSTPEKMNEQPYGDGWICVIEASGPEALEGLLDATSYESLTVG